MSAEGNPQPSESGDDHSATVRVVVGRIGKAHGLRGDVLVHVRTDDPDARFEAGAQVIAAEPVSRTLVIEQSRWHSGRLLVKFAGVDDRNAAEALRTVVLEADIDAAATPDDPEEYFDRHLVGLTALTPQGAVLGTVADVIHLPGHDLLSVHTPQGSEALVPFVRSIVPIVDVSAGRVVVAAPQGLFDSAVDAGAADTAEGGDRSTVSTDGTD
ncbi:MAG: ribosome maturation factor RimM [Actinomycetes bacterium]